MSKELELVELCLRGTRAAIVEVYEEMGQRGFIWGQEEPLIVDDDDGSQCELFIMVLNMCHNGIVKADMMLS